jgi:hypothetical protein
MPPIYRGTDKEAQEWTRNLILFLNQELLRLSGQANDLEIQVADIQARMTAHGI